MLRRHLRAIALSGFSVCLIFVSTFTSTSQTPDGTSRKVWNNQKPRPQPEEGQASPDVIPYWNQLSTQSKGSLAVTWNKRTGTPRSIFGNLGKAPNGASETSARSFLKQNAPLFKLNAVSSDLTLARSQDSLIGKHFVFQQHYRGVPVYGAQLGIHFNSAGEIVTINNTYEPQIELNSVVPRLSESDATLRSLNLLGALEASEANADLIVMGLVDSSFSLAWRIVVPTLSATWEIFIDSQDGKVLDGPRNINRYVNGMGQVFNVSAVVATQDNSLRDNRDKASAVPPSAYSLVTLEGLVGHGYLDGLYASSSGSKKRVFDRGQLFLDDRSGDGFGETMGYYYIDYAERYIQSLGFNNVNNRQQVFAVDRLKADNSFYSPSSKEISLGTGGVDDSEDAEVILHEYGHSIQDNQVPHFGNSIQAASMGEGFGDYWAASVGAQFSGGFQDLCLAEWDATFYSNSTPPCLRRLDSVKHYPEDLSGEIHNDGEIWSAALWQVRTSIGASSTDRAVIAAHFLLSPAASFNDGANALVTAAASLGYPQHELMIMRNVLRARGFTVTA